MNSNEPLRVAIVTRSLVMGGTQNHIVKLCNSINPKNAEISLFLLINDEAFDFADLLPNYVQYFVSPYTRHHPLTINWLSNQLLKQQTQIAHSFLWVSDLYTAISQIYTKGIPVITSERGDRRPNKYYNKIKNILDRAITFRLANKVCTNSKFGKQILINSGCRENKIVIIPNGIDITYLNYQKRFDIRKHYNLPNESKVIGYVGRLENFKGVDTIIKASLPFRDREIYFVIIGDGSEKNDLETAARYYGVKKKFLFVGKKIPSLPFIKDFDIALMATKTSESFSNSLLEYAACGKPIIATNVGGNPEIIEHERNGLLIEPNNSLSLSKNIQILLDDPGYAKKLGEAAKKKIMENYRMDIIANKFLDLWKNQTLRYQ